MRKRIRPDRGADDEEIRRLDEETLKERVTGKVYQETTLKDFNLNSPAIYTCSIREGNTASTARKRRCNGIRC